MLYTITENYEVIRKLEIEADSPKQAIERAREMNDEDWFVEPEEVAITEQTLELTLPVEKYEEITHVTMDNEKFIFLDHNFTELEKSLV